MGCPPNRVNSRRTLISSTSAQHRGSRHRIHDTRGFSKAFLWGRDVLSEDQALNTTSSGSSSLSTPGNGYGCDVCSDSGRAKREGEAVVSRRADQPLPWPSRRDASGVHLRRIFTGCRRVRLSHLILRNRFADGRARTGVSRRARMALVGWPAQDRHPPTRTVSHRAVE